MTGEAPDAPKNSSPFAFLQPCAELSRARAPIAVRRLHVFAMPVLQSQTHLCVLRPQGDGAVATWYAVSVSAVEFSPLVCARLLQEVKTNYRSILADQFLICASSAGDACHTYIKSIDLDDKRLGDPLVDELASVPARPLGAKPRLCQLHPTSRKCRRANRARDSAASRWIQSAETLSNP